MRNRFAACALALTVALGSCASVGRAMSYGSDLADAKVSVGARQFAVWVHDVDRTLLINRNNGASMGQGLADGLTFGAAGGLPAPLFRAAADAVLSTMGCKALDVYQLGGQGVSWEATYECPDGVDPRKEVATRRDAWRAGLTTPNPLLSGART